jgi:hypothetical protein
MVKLGVIKYLMELILRKINTKLGTENISYRPIYLFFQDGSVLVLVRDGHSYMHIQCS